MAAHLGQDRCERGNALAGVLRAAERADVQLLQLRERQLFDAELFRLCIDVRRHAGEVRVVEANDLAVLGQPQVALRA